MKYFHGLFRINLLLSCLSRRVFYFISTMPQLIFSLLFKYFLYHSLLHYTSFQLRYIRMAVLQFFLLLIMVSCTNSFWCGKVDVKFDTKYDNNHNELKQLLTEHQTFKPTNWTHYAYVVMLIVGAVVFLTILVYVYRCCWPMIKLVYHAQQSKTCLNRSVSILPSYYPTPYTHTQNQIANDLLPHNNSSVLSPRHEPTSSIQLPPSRIV